MGTSLMPHDHSTSRKPHKVRGYRIRGYSQDWQAFDTGVQFLKDIPLDAWEMIISSATIRAATLYRSGRKFKQYLCND